MPIPRSAGQYGRPAEKRRLTRARIEVQAARFQMAVWPTVGGEERAGHMTGAGRLKDSDQRMSILAIRASGLTSHADCHQRRAKDDHVHPIAAQDAQICAACVLISFEPAAAHIGGSGA